MISPTLVFDPTAEPVARALLGAGAYVMKLDAAEDEFFEWKSGIRAPVYTDCRVLNGDPGARAIVARSLGSSIRANFPGVEYIVGIADAGIVWSTLAANDLSLGHAFVRKKKKAHGRPAFVEGSPREGVNAVIVDDLVASGGSLERAIRLLAEERKIRTIGIQSIVNWDFLEMRDIFRALNIKVRALVGFPQILNAAQASGTITEAVARELSAFYRNPREHRWNLDQLRPHFTKAS